MLFIVKNAVKKRVPIKPNSTVHILGYTDKEMLYSTTTAMLHSSVLQQSWRDLEIEHGLIQYQCNSMLLSMFETRYLLFLFVCRVCRHLYTILTEDFTASWNRVKKPARHSNALAIVKNAVKKRVPIKPNSTVHILGYTDKEMLYSTTTAMLQHHCCCFGTVLVHVLFPNLSSFVEGQKSVT
jgi:hypothetical protein